MYNTVKATWEQNQKEEIECQLASNSYKASYDEMQAIFKKHRTQSLIFFKKQPDLLIPLGVKGRFPAKYNDFFDKVKQFYSAIKDNATIQAEVKKIKITPEVVSEIRWLKHDS